VDTEQKNRNGFVFWLSFFGVYSSMVELRWIQPDRNVLLEIVCTHLKTQSVSIISVKTAGVVFLEKIAVSQ